MNNLEEMDIEENLKELEDYYTFLQVFVGEDQLNATDVIASELIPRLQDLINKICANREIKDKFVIRQINNMGRKIEGII